MRLAFEVTGVFHVGDGVSRDDWSDVELHEIAIGYRLSDRERVVEHEIEGVRVQVRVPDAQRWERGLLADLTFLAELVQGPPGLLINHRPDPDWQNKLVQAAVMFAKRHGPLCLCDAHGRAGPHEPSCDNRLPEQERVVYILGLAQQCYGAIQASELLRSGERIPEEFLTMLNLEEFPPSPSIPYEATEPEDRRKLVRRLGDPVVKDWRRLEARLELLGQQAAGTWGCMPALIRQLAAACARGEPMRVCHNPTCVNVFAPTPPQRRFCNEVRCKRSRTLQRQGKMFKCPRCGRPVGAGHDACPYCESPLRARELGGSS